MLLLQYYVHRDILKSVSLICLRFLTKNCLMFSNCVWRNFGVKVTCSSSGRKVQAYRGSTFTFLSHASLDKFTSFRLESFNPKKRKGTSGPIEKAFINEVGHQLRTLIARTFYIGGIPFHLVKNLYHVKSYTFAANNRISGFVPGL